LFPRQQRIQRNAADVFHDDARALGSLSDASYNGHHIRMLEPRHQQRFPLKPLAELGIRRDMVVHDLDHDLPAEVRLPG